MTAADERQPEFHAVPGGLVRIVVLPGLEEDERGDEREDDDDPPLGEEIARRADEDGGAERNLAAGRALDERGELRNERGDENDGNADAGEDQERRIDHREDQAGSAARRGS